MAPRTIKVKGQTLNLIWGGYDTRKQAEGSGRIYKRRGFTYITVRKFNGAYALYAK